MKDRLTLTLVILCSLFIAFLFVLRQGRESEPNKPGLRASAQPSRADQPVPPAVKRAEKIAPIRKSSAPGLQSESQRASAAVSDDELSVKFRQEAEELSRRRLQYDQPGEAAEFFVRRRLPAGERQLPMERYFEARSHLRQMQRYSTAAGSLLPAQAAPGDEASEQTTGAIGTWTPLGPGNIGGRTRAILIHPARPEIMYAAGVAGGVWKTMNGGASWMPLNDLMSSLAVCSLVMDPQNPQVIYAGTGEGFFNIDGLRGAGIFKTTDGGATWQRLGSTNTSDFYYVNDLVISPTNSQRIYAATDTGVWRSDNGGATWTLSRKAKEEEPGGCLDLAIRTDRQTDVLFASFATFRQATIYRNTDAGGSGEWMAVLSEAGMERTSLAIAPSDQNVIYALATGGVPGFPEPNGLNAVYRSTSGGDPGSWSPRVRGDSSVQLNRLLLANPIIAMLGECGFGRNQIYSQGWYNNVIAVDPRDPVASGRAEPICSALMTAG